MDKTSSQISKKGMFAALAGTVLIALCCFTPILLVLLGAVGLSAFTPYLDLVLLPALVIMIVLTIVSYLRLRKSVKNNCYVRKTEGMGIVKDLICHCFEYSVDDINQDYLEHGKSTIMEKIQMEKKFGNCQCATKNPKGK